MIVAVLLLACATEEPAPTGPVADGGAVAAQTLCKLLEGALQVCEVRGSEVSWGKRTLSVEVVLTSEEEKFGQFAFDALEQGSPVMGPAIREITPPDLDGVQLNLTAQFMVLE